MKLFGGLDEVNSSGRRRAGRQWYSSSVPESLSADAVAADKCAKSVDLVRVAEREDARFQVASWTTLESSKRGVRVV